MIPTELRWLTSLESMRFESNHLSGKIPCEFTKLNPRNDLELANLTDIEFVVFCYNNKTDAKPDNPKLRATGSDSPQTSSIPIIGGVVSAVVVLAIFIGIYICYCQRRNKKTQAFATDELQSANGTNVAEPLSSSSLTSSSSVGRVEVAESNATNEFLVARDYKPLQEKSHILDNLAGSPLDGSQDVTVKTLAVAGNSSANVSIALSSGDFTSKGGPRILPENPTDWNMEETAQWLLQRFGNVKLSSMALGQRINGRTLLMMEREDLISGLGLQTVGDWFLFEEAVAELRSRSAQQSAQGGESPPSYQ
ncbi:hypothetical protein CcCBS67573_g09249 [Chytriomyces confervae]|uniref:SAM domain-containing protein n=1 Tax=Chytriomyces confervae TaxID=246404 RepID=A0A507E0W6_9FUNG|nr:hypothetical protein CcCBS67573_g09249 [Chytriomyces confervae]